MPARLASAADYAEALDAIARRGIAQSVRRMLSAHHAMPNRIATMRHLSAAAGYSSHSVANRLYGGFAGRLRRELGIRYTGLSLWTIATWPAPPVDEAREFSFRMRPELAAALLRVGLIDSEAIPPTTGKNARTAIEGATRRSLREHRHRERRLRDAKIAEATAQSPDGRLRCGVPGCGFDFEEAYGDLGRGYMQVHHLQPLASRATAEETRLEELILVCANCHVMIHRFGESRTTTGLRRRA